MHSVFWPRPWTPETFSLTADNRVFEIAARTANVSLPVGCSPRASTAVFFARGDGPGHDVASVQHLQHVEWRIAELTLLKTATHALYGALAADIQVINSLGLDIVDDPGAVQIAALAQTVKVPPPPKFSWEAAVVALYAPNPTNAIAYGWGAVKDFAASRYSPNELTGNTYLLLQSLRRATSAWEQHNRSRRP